MNEASPSQTMLLVDDDLEFCKALSAAMRRRGFETVIATNYDEAIEEAKAWTPVRAVVDLRMPGKGGLEVVAALKQLNPEIAIVLLTGYGSIATAIEAIKLGAVHYLTKPAKIVEVLDAFERGDGVLPDEAAQRESPKPSSLDELEWEHLQRVLNDTGGNISEAARLLGMHRRSLQRKLAKGAPQKEEGDD